jgi:hypothetical protein
MTTVEPSTVPSARGTFLEPLDPYQARSDGGVTPPIASRDGGVGGRGDAGIRDAGVGGSGRTDGGVGGGRRDAAVGVGGVRSDGGVR